MRRRWIAVACVLSAGAGFAVAAVLAPLRPSSADIHKDGIFRVDTDQRLVALTFDDGPDPRWTPTVLALLRQHHANATFFQIGKNAEAYPDLVHALLLSGNEIGNHTWDHPDLETLSAPAVQNEIEQGAAALRRVGVPNPKYFRPPKGLTDDIVGVVADANRYDTVFWNICVEHFVNHRPDVAGGVQDLLGRVRPGSIILAHDGGIPNRAKTLEALPRLLDGLEQRGYRIVDVTELLRSAKDVNP